MSGDTVERSAVQELAAKNSKLKAELDEAMREAARLKEELSAMEKKRRAGATSSASGAKAPPASQSRYWTKEEHERFLKALELYGPKNVKSIADYVKTRNATQVRTHAQKYFMKLAKNEALEKEQDSDSSARENTLSSGERNGIDLLVEVATEKGSLQTTY